MDKVLIKSSKIGIKKSPVHGWGVFALEDIEIGDIVEECHFVTVECDDSLILGRLKDYLYTYPRVTGVIRKENKSIINS